MLPMKNYVWKLCRMAILVNHNVVFFSLLMSQKWGNTIFVFRFEWRDGFYTQSIVNGLKTNAPLPSCDDIMRIQKLNSDYYSQISSYFLGTKRAIFELQTIHSPGCVNMPPAKRNKAAAILTPTHFFLKNNFNLFG